MPKQLLAIAGVSLVRRAVGTVVASQCDPVFVVVAPMRGRSPRSTGTWNHDDAWPTTFAQVARP
jgi:CTP:molybdopterin cytidylyltransferase MocA